MSKWTGKSSCGFSPIQRLQLGAGEVVLLEKNKLIGGSVLNGPEDIHTSNSAWTQQVIFTNILYTQTQVCFNNN